MFGVVVDEVLVEPTEVLLQFNTGLLDAPAPTGVVRELLQDLVVGQAPVLPLLADGVAARRSRVRNDVRIRIDIETSPSPQMSNSSGADALALEAMKDVKFSPA